MGLKYHRVCVYKQIQELCNTERMQVTLRGKSNDDKAGGGHNRLVL